MTKRDIVGRYKGLSCRGLLLTLYSCLPFILAFFAGSQVGAWERVGGLSSYIFRRNDKPIEDRI